MGIKEGRTTVNAGDIKPKEWGPRALHLAWQLTSSVALNLTQLELSVLIDKMGLLNCALGKTLP